jgi:hypothetical protein
MIFPQSKDRSMWIARLKIQTCYPHPIIRACSWRFPLDQMESVIELQSSKWTIFSIFEIVLIDSFSTPCAQPLEIRSDDEISVLMKLADTGSELDTERTMTLICSSDGLPYWIHLWSSSMDKFNSSESFLLIRPNLWKSVNSENLRSWKLRHWIFRSTKWFGPARVFRVSKFMKTNYHKMSLGVDQFVRDRLMIQRRWGRSQNVTRRKLAALMQ